MGTRAAGKKTSLVDEEPTGGWFLGIGGLIILLGIVLSANLLLATIAATAIIEASIFIVGVLIMIHAFADRRNWRAVVWFLLGAFYCGLSIWLAINPTTAIGILTIAVAAMMFASGIVRLTVSLMVRRKGWGWITFSGVMGIAAGLIVASGWPGNAVWVLGLVLAIDLLFQGIAFVAVGFAFQANRRMAHSAFARQFE